MADYRFKELSELMQAIKASDEKLTPEERNRNYAEEGLDELVSIVNLLKETEESFNMLFDNPVLDVDSSNSLARLWLAIGEFIMTESGHIEKQLAHYIEEDEDIYG